MVNNRDVMRRNSSPSRLPAPYLKSIRLDPAKPFDANTHPFSLSCLTAEPFHIDFTHPVTILVGPNGSGKSTISA
jgi:predicted ATPase